MDSQILPDLGAGFAINCKALQDVVVCSILSNLNPYAIRAGATRHSRTSGRHMLSSGSVMTTTGCFDPTE
jgi:hypothetical protein